jgi:hypothetical protein
LSQRDGFAAVGSEHRLKTNFAQVVIQQPADRLLVIGDQDAF